MEDVVVAIIFMVIIVLGETNVSFKKMTLKYTGRCQTRKCRSKENVEFFITKLNETRAHGSEHCELQLHNIVSGLILS